MSSHPDDEDMANLGPPAEIPVPDIYDEPAGDTARMPKLRNINQSPDSDDEGFDPYDTAVLVKE